VLVDTHCHIHESDYPLSMSETLTHAYENDVHKFICVGTSNESSDEAYAFTQEHSYAYFSVGVHPHETNRNDVGASPDENISYLEELIQKVHSEGNGSKLIAVGEIGLDYFYTHSSKEMQIAALHKQIELAVKNDLPIIFHVREAFEDFWPIFDSFTPRIRGVMHSFTDSKENMLEAVKRGLYIGVNGISTFTKLEAQKDMFRSIPLSSLLLETDSPFLTPEPYRGKVNEPAFVKNVAEYHAKVRGITLEQIATATTANANALFAI